MNRREAMKGALGLAAVAVAAPVAAMVPTARPEGLPPRLDHRSPVGHSIRARGIDRFDPATGEWIDDQHVTSITLARGLAFHSFERSARRGRYRIRFQPEVHSCSPIESFVAQRENYIAACVRFGCDWNAETFTLTGPKTPYRAA